ncbi:MAG: lamin tail domain-containing protein, partial [Verrucomicrobia bacterium]|nr:lamin tail domain-containing protein [Verrucomicrobiota bacterium]
GVVNYLDQRAAFIRSALPLSTPFSITSNGGNNFATSNATVTLAGTSPINARDIQVNSRSYPLLWTSPTTWSLTVPLTAYTNLLVVQGVDNSGVPLANLTATITVTNLGLPAPRPVVINEWMADNAGPGGFLEVLSGKHSDWFELYNPNASSVNLSGFYLTDTLSQPTKWQIPTNTAIAAHGFLLVWADKRTPLNGVDPNGDLHADFQLDNSGEAIGLYAPDGTPQHTVTFGPQMQNVSQGLFPDGNTDAILFMPDWTPRASNRLGLPAAPAMTGTVGQNGGLVSFSFATVPNRTYRVEYKDDLEAAGWTPLEADLTATGGLLNITGVVAVGHHWNWQPHQSKQERCLHGQFRLRDPDAPLRPKERRGSEARPLTPALSHPMGEGGHRTREGKLLRPSSFPRRRISEALLVSRGLFAAGQLFPRSFRVWVQPHFLGDIVKFLPADSIKGLAVGGKLLVDLDDFLGHDLMGFLAAAHQGKVGSERQAFVAVRVQPHAEHHGTSFRLSRNLHCGSKYGVGS